MKSSGVIARDVARLKLLTSADAIPVVRSDTMRPSSPAPSTEIAYGRPQQGTPRVSQQRPSLLSQKVDPQAAELPFHRHRLNPNRSRVFIQLASRSYLHTRTTHAPRKHVFWRNLFYILHSVSGITDSRLAKQPVTT